ncbi:fumarylacetoacetate hydrolase family protein [Rothia sp. (in: high G+C Gram-positive bacteria)]|uniref:fumarylacetoacetate hydrolase family protein n=1 Tax=Rothia sp. (in: high G+C Gram-positive bacteria) TaxID=1885016 RepID=UPI000EDFC36A|nr:FAA hydrolase family protein [Rothia sp. (in: high G+C Gram-positive bacteria)]
MKFAQILLRGKPVAVIEQGSRWYQLDKPLADYLATSEVQVISAEHMGAQPLDLSEDDFIRPLSNVSRVLCVGLNFTDHAKEVGAETPSHPTIFTKFGNALIGPGEQIQMPTESNKIDWEVELCAVVGKEGRRIPVEEAEEYLLGYTVLNDVSVRDWQGRTSEWFQGKNWDSMTPFGPVIVSPDELDIAGGLAMTCTVDGETRQQGSTANLIFKPAEVISYISTFMTLQPGDLIALGTPAGVGLSLRPRKWLAPGQTVVTEIEGIGRLTNVCSSEGVA